MMQTTDKWQIWYAARGGIKGIAIVHTASSHALELHTDLLPEHRKELLEGFCDKLNRPIDFRALVEERAVRYTRNPLALTALCNLCGETTESMNLNRMEPPVRHVKDCPLATPSGGAVDER
jgi:hypothetical protein